MRHFILSLLAIVLFLGFNLVTAAESKSPDGATKIAASASEASPVTTPVGLEN